MIGKKNEKNFNCVDIKHNNQVIQYYKLKNVKEFYIIGTSEF